MGRDYLKPSHEEEKNSHKLKRMVPSVNSYFMDVKCSGCNTTTVLFSHAQSVITCKNCDTVIAKSSGGKCNLTAGSAFKVKI